MTSSVLYSHSVSQSGRATFQVHHLASSNPPEQCVSLKDKSKVTPSWPLEFKSLERNLISFLPSPKSDATFLYFCAASPHTLSNYREEFGVVVAACSAVSFPPGSWRDQHALLINDSVKRWFSFSQYTFHAFLE